MAGDDRGYGYVYDFENRLVKVFADSDHDGVLDGGETTIWTANYDALGRRIRTVNGATTTHYYYDGQNVVAEYSWNGSAETLKRYYVHGATYIDERAVMRAIGNNSVDYYYYPRELWSVDGLVNNRGHEVEHYTYDAYGLPLIKSVDYRDVNYDGLRDVADRNLILTKVSQAPCTAGPIYDLQGDGDIDSSDAYVAYTLWEQQQSYRALVSLDASGITNPYLFTGQVYDGDGRYHYRHRWYDAINGRFGQRDPLGTNELIEWKNNRPRFKSTQQNNRIYQDGMNLYEYVRSNSLKYSDPLGETILKCCRKAEGLPGKHCWLTMVDDNKAIWSNRQCIGMIPLENPDAVKSGCFRCAVGFDCEWHEDPNHKYPPWDDIIDNDIPGVDCEIVGVPGEGEDPDHDGVIEPIDDSSYQECIRNKAIQIADLWDRKPPLWSPAKNCENLADSILNWCGLKAGCVNWPFCGPNYPQPSR